MGFNLKIAKNAPIEQYDALLEKKLKIHHGDEKNIPTVTEARLDDADKRDDRTHKTNTLPINELAEEAQRARIKARGDGDGLEKDHFQEYKKQDLGLMDANFARLSTVNSKIDKLFMSASWNRLTTGEKYQLKKLIAQRDEIIRC